MRFSPLLFAFLSVVPLTACSHAESGSGQPAATTPPSGAPTLTMRYQPEIGDLVIEADRPLHVALFRVPEKSAPHMLFPVRAHRVARVGPDRPLRVTSRWLGLPTDRIGAGNIDVGSKAPIITEPDPRGDAERIPPARGHHPIYLYALASTEPLATAPIVDRNGTVEYDRAFSHNVLGPKLQVLANRLLTATADSTWTGVLEVIWR